MPVDEPPRIPSLRKSSRAVGETFLVVDLIGIGDERHVGDIGNEIFADAFDRPASGFDQLAGLHLFVKNRTRRVGQNHFDSAPRFDPIEESAETGQRSAGTDADNDRIDIVPHLLPNFRAGAAFVRERIGRIAKLIHVKRAGNFFGQTRRDVLIIFRMAAGHVGARQIRTSAPSALTCEIFSCDILSGITSMTR